MANKRLSIASQFLSGAGAYRAGHIMRAMSYMSSNEGNSETQSPFMAIANPFTKAGNAVNTFATSMESASTGLVSLVGAVGPLAIAVVGLTVVAGAMKIGFDTLEKSTTALVGSIAKIGGARGLEEMFVEASSNDKLIRQARMSVTADERMTTKEMLGMAQEVSHDPSAGAFTTAEWLRTIKGIGTETGRQESLPKELLTFLGQYANVSSMTAEESGSVYSRIRKENKGMSDADIERVMLAGHAVGQRGSFSASELPEAAKLMQLEGLVQGTGEQALMQLFTTGTLLKSGGANNLSQAGVQLKAMIKMAEQHHMFTKDGQVDVGAMNEYIVSNKNLPEWMLKGRGLEYKSELMMATSPNKEEASSFTPEAIAHRTGTLDQYKNLSMSLEDFRKEVDASIAPQDRFKATFNRIADELEGKFLDTLISLEKPFSDFADIIVSKKDKIGEFFDKLAAWMATLLRNADLFTNVLLLLAHVMKKGIEILVSLIPGVASSLPDATLKENQAKDKVSKLERDVIEHPNDLDLKKELEQAKKDLITAEMVKKGFESAGKIDDPDFWKKEAKKTDEQEEKDREDAAYDKIHKRFKGEDPDHPDMYEQSLPSSKATGSSNQLTGKQASDALLKAIHDSLERQEKHAAQTATNTTPKFVPPSRSIDGT